MKVRFVGEGAGRDTNSIRFRLRKSDVQLWRKNGAVTDCLRFPIGSWTASLATAESEQIEATIHGGELTIKWPKSEAIAWLDDDTKETMHGLVKFGSDQALTVLIERDGLCADGRDKDDQDVFREFGGVHE
jgi:hypothetical protein